MVFKKRLGSDYRKTAKDLANMGSFSFLLAGSIFLGYYAGDFLDRHLGTSPFFLIVFILLGIIGTFIEFLTPLLKKTKIKKDQKQIERSENDK